jgi:antitoxin CcdA
MRIGGAMNIDYRVNASRRAVNLSLNSDLLRLGKELGVNISNVAEEALAYAVKEALAERWARENMEAIQSYNAHIESQGVFSDGSRTF